MRDARRFPQTKTVQINELQCNGASTYLKRISSDEVALKLMEYRQLGKSGLKVPELCFGAGTFGGGNEFFKAWAETTTGRGEEDRRHLHGRRNQLFDTADIYSDGRARRRWARRSTHLKREDVLISTKATFRLGKGPNDVGSSRYHLIQSLERSLKRLGTDYIDVYHLHAFDATTPVEETLRALDDLVREGKVRYIACSNFSGWHLMKSLSVSERYGWSRYVGHQAYYSLVGRDYEWELMPLALDQGVGALVWSPLGWGRLTGKIRRGSPMPKESRLHEGGRGRGRRCRKSICTRWSMRLMRSRRRRARRFRRLR